MDAFWKTVIWQQFGAAIDMLENAVNACPDNVWRKRADESGYHDFWYISYHTLFFLDYYLSDSSDGFTPPAPFTLDELDPAGLLPDHVFTKDELLTYLAHGRKKCRTAVAAMTDVKMRQRCGFERLELSVGELLLYNMRHVQHHAAQLNLILRKSIDSAPRWVGKTKIELGPNRL